MSGYIIADSLVMSAAEAQALHDRVAAIALEHGDEAKLIWTLYRFPEDARDAMWLARPFVPTVAEGAVAIRQHLEADTLEELRAQLPKGLQLLPRQEGDEPAVAEIWL